jgi:hypothetical protein
VRGRLHDGANIAHRDTFARMTSASCVPDLDVAIDISLDGFAEGCELLVFQTGTGFPDANNIAGSELTVHQ